MIDPEKLDAILEVLQDRGVTNFTCPEFSVTMTLPPDEAYNERVLTAMKEAKEAQRAAVTHGPYKHPSLNLTGFPGNGA